MGNSPDFQKLRKHMTIFRVAQVFLFVILIFMAVNFQAQFVNSGKSPQFLKSVIAALIIQLILFYPINKFAAGDAEREMAATNPAATQEELSKLRSKRIVSDFTKAAVFIFFITFISTAPAILVINCTVFFVFILSVLTYFQCYNFVIRRAIKNR
ncbi:MAG: hypothetical protein HYS23_08635 [Geobacter sp.]|nr:hypothetical protein [Geobacter sp.]